VNLAQELDLPILTSDMRLSRAAGQTMRMELLRGIGPA
jgi:predicted nucleic acid-binding protein